MVELIERGHVLIAQPPLYKMKRGRAERYITTESELTRYQLEIALEDARVDVEGSGTIDGEQLKDLAERYYAVLDHINRLQRVFPTTVLEQLLYQPRFDSAQLSSREAVESWLALLQDAMASLSDSQVQYQFDITEDVERHLFYPTVAVVNHGVRQEYIFTGDFFQSQDYDSFANFGAEISALIDGVATVHKGEKSETVRSLKAALDWLQAEALRGLTRQRYKGLGEMNWDQLQETTMDPNKRSMLRVTIEDAIAADKMFTTLMGEQVEPRKNFMVENGMTVANLDI
jgi:DNA gyrase subunit B